MLRLQFSVALLALAACGTTEPHSDDGVRDSFDLELVYVGNFTPGERQLIDEAAARWSALVVDGLADVAGIEPGLDCDGGPDETDLRPVDDLRVFVDLRRIDGPGGALGEAGPCAIRESDGLPIVSSVVFDEADRLTLRVTHDFYFVALHELAHALGFGTLWNDRGFLFEEPPVGGLPEIYYSGDRAKFAFAAVVRGYNGTTVPVENDTIQYPSGIRTHWRESFFGQELMTTFFGEDEPHPLSVVTLASLEDLGYRTDLGAADNFGIYFGPTPPPAPSARPARQFGDDVRQGAIAVVDSLGRTVGSIRR